MRLKNYGGKLDELIQRYGFNISDYAGGIDLCDDWSGVQICDLDSLIQAVGRTGTGCRSFPCFRSSAPGCGDMRRPGTGLGFEEVECMAGQRRMMSCFGNWNGCIFPGNYGVVWIHMSLTRGGD